MTSVDNTFELQQRIATYDDEPAYKELFFIFSKPLTRFAISFVHNKESAEEIVSDVFIKLWERRKTLPEIDNLRIYLYISTKNTALNYLGRQNRSAVIDIDVLNINLPAPALNPEQLMISAEMLKNIYQAINSLPSRCKLIFKLVKEERLPYKEIAGILNISVKTIDNQLAIALKKISEKINSKLRTTAEWR